MTYNQKLTALFVQAAQAALLGDAEKGHQMMDEYDKLAGRSSRPPKEEQDSKNPESKDSSSQPDS